MNYRTFKNNNGFTLVELIVSITISIILMVSVGVFISSGIKNITLQGKLIDESTDFLDFNKKIESSFSRFNSNKEPILTSSGVLFKVSRDFSEGGFSFIGEKILSEIYCFSGAEDIKTKHILVKTFVPFEGIGADIFTFTGTNQKVGGIQTNYFSGSVVGEGTGKYLGPTDVYKKENDIYVSDTLGNAVLKNGIIVVGKGIFGKNEKRIPLPSLPLEGEVGPSGTGIYLNNPTGLAYGEEKIFISDTLNNRILAFDTTTNKIYKLLDETDGLNEPTGLFYDDKGKRLFISNSGKGEILEFSSSGSLNPNLNIKFIPESEFTANKFSLEFFDLSGLEYNSNISFSNISFTGIIAKESFIKTSLNKIDYYFVDYSSIASLQEACVVNEYILVSGKPIRCVSSGTGNTSTSQDKRFSTGSLYEINVSEISPNFSSTGAYYVKLSFFNGGRKEFEDNFPYFVQGDNKVFTKNDNTLKTITGGLGYPTGISFNGNYLIINDFLSREQKTISLNGDLVSNTELAAFNFSNLIYNKYSDTILETPIKNLKIDYSSNLLTLKLKYFKVYNCYNLDEKVERDLILKKSLNNY